MTEADVISDEDLDAWKKLAEDATAIDEGRDKIPLSPVSLLRLVMYARGLEEDIDNWKGDAWERGTYD